MVNSAHVAPGLSGATDDLPRPPVPSALRGIVDGSSALRADRGPTAQDTQRRRQRAAGPAAEFASLAGVGYAVQVALTGIDLRFSDRTRL